ncbi:MAG TPA: hypothetical protein PK992_12835 [Planctomycetaceae bacterium]|nr:hypothetical protein [Planctomycetaceae bacterium]
MWKLLCGIGLTLFLFPMADDTPLQPGVSVECCGRLRHGVVEIGGETTGTTITFNRIVWELQLNSDAHREFAKQNHKEPVIVTGTLRKIVGIETKIRWIIDVRTISKPDATKDEEGAKMTIEGILRTADPRNGDFPEMMVRTHDQVWPIDVSADAELQTRANLFIGRCVLLTGSLERVTEQVDDEESDTPLVVRVKTLKRSVNVPVQGQSD